MRKGTEFLKITEKPIPKDDDVELIRITEGGFFPNYSLNNDVELCLSNNNKGDTIMKIASQNTGDNLDRNICKSHYTKVSTGVLDAVGTLAINTISTVTTFGTNIYNKQYLYQPRLDIKKILKVIKDNNLVSHRNKFIVDLENAKEAKKNREQKEKRKKDREKKAELKKRYQKQKFHITPSDILNLRGTIEGRSEATIIITLAKINSKNLNKSEVYKYVQK